ncbi:MAG: cytochrome c maturation protein CcmE [Terriglobales bacterium]
MRKVTWKFGALIVIMLAALAWLAFTAVRDTKAYFVTVTELETMPPAQAHTVNLRVAGDVVPGSIRKNVTEHGAMETTFEITQGGHVLPVAYVGTDPLPDTFVNNAQAVASGRWLPDGTFRASGVQAKCASKYEPKYARKLGRGPRTSAGMMN